MTKNVINIVGFILEEKQNQNIRKHNNLELKLLVNEDNQIPEFLYDPTKEIKTQIQENLNDIFKLTKDCHLEQVYTLAESFYYNDNKINMIYLMCLNKADIINLSDKYKLVDFEIEINKKLRINETEYFYQTVQNISNNNIEYYHQFFDVKKELEKELVMILTAYKYLKVRISYTDVIFKLLPKRFSLEDVKLTYELISKKKIDKSNFRKKIINYCQKTDEFNKNKGYRPTQLYEFKLNKKDIWI